MSHPTEIHEIYGAKVLDRFRHETVFSPEDFFPVEFFRASINITDDVAVAHRMTGRFPERVVGKAVDELARHIAKKLLTEHREYLSLERGFNVDTGLEEFRVTAEVRICHPTKTR